MNLKKQEAGRLGGLSTVAKHGKEHMKAIGKRGAAELWRRYALMPWQVSGWQLVERATGRVRAQW